MLGGPWRIKIRLVPNGEHRLFGRHFCTGWAVTYATQRLPEMNTRLHIPFRFILGKIQLNWHDIQFGLRNEYLENDDVVQLAIDYVTREPNAEPIEVELAGLLHKELSAVPNFVDELCDRTSCDDADTFNKWLFIILAWLYDQREVVSNPLELVAEVYADFGYPAYISKFVYYMPPSDDYRPQDHTAEENRKRLLRLWQEYLEVQSAVFRGANAPDRGNK